MFIPTSNLPFVSITSLGLRLYVSVNLLSGSYHRFKKHMEQEHQGIHYMSFVTTGAVDVGLVARLPTPSNMARILSITPLNPREAQVLSMVHGHDYGTRPFKEYTVWEYLVGALEVHDRQFPNQREAFVKFVFQGQPIPWQHWNQNVKEFLGVVFSKKPPLKPSPAEAKKNVDKIASTSQPKKKAKKSAGKVMKKPSKS